jgi:hypothetical protein
MANEVITPTDLRELKNNSNFLACAMIRHAYGTAISASVLRRAQVRATADINISIFV